MGLGETKNGNCLGSWWHFWGQCPAVGMALGEHPPDVHPGPGVCRVSGHGATSGCVTCLGGAGDIRGDSDPRLGAATTPGSSGPRGDSPEVAGDSRRDTREWHSCRRALPVPWPVLSKGQTLFGLALGAKPSRRGHFLEIPLASGHGRRPEWPELRGRAARGQPMAQPRLAHPRDVSPEGSGDTGTLWGCHSGVGRKVRSLASLCLSLSITG